MYIHFTAAVLLPLFFVLSEIDVQYFFNPQYPA
jgi:hypothetical protein